MQMSIICLPALPFAAARWKERLQKLQQLVQNAETLPHEFQVRRNL